MEPHSIILNSNQLEAPAPTLLHAVSPSHSFKRSRTVAIAVSDLLSDLFLFALFYSLSDLLLLLGEVTLPRNIAELLNVVRRQLSICSEP
jgi:hypothetical protein